MIQELNLSELIEINGGDDQANKISANQWGHMCGHALGTTMYEVGVIFGTLLLFVP